MSLFSHSVMPDSLRTCGLQHARLPCPSLSPGVWSNSCPLSSDFIQPFHLLLTPSPPALNLSQHQGLFQWVSSLHQVTKVLELSASALDLPMSIQGWFPLGLTDLISLVSKGPQQYSPASQFKSINSSTFSLLYGPNLTSIHEYWKNHSVDYIDLGWWNDIFAFQYAV